MSRTVHGSMESTVRPSANMRSFVPRVALVLSVLGDVSPLKAKLRQPLNRTYYPVPSGSPQLPSSAHELSARRSPPHLFVFPCRKKKEALFADAILKTGEDNYTHHQRFTICAKTA